MPSAAFKVASNVASSGASATAGVRPTALRGAAAAGEIQAITTPARRAAGRETGTRAARAWAARGEWISTASNASGGAAAAVGAVR